MPLHDPNGIMFNHLKSITPKLKDIFGQAIVSITKETTQMQYQYASWLETQKFFRILSHKVDLTIGEDFLMLYAFAAACCQHDQILHLCFIDRVAFALQSNYSKVFIEDVQGVRQEDTPLIFRRSEKAWRSHPRNYFALEQMVTQVGKFLFGKELDFGWCHLALQAHRLKTILPFIQNRDLSMVAEMVLLLRDEIRSKDVDWLGWEDPYIYARNPTELKTEREQSKEEVRKRLSYVIPMLKLLYKAVC